MSIRNYLPSFLGGSALPGDGSNSKGDAKKALNLPTSADVKEEEVFTGFDPRGLERAAKAAKELDSTSVGKDAIKLQMEEQRTKQYENAAKIEENKARAEAMGVEKVKKEAEERRRNIELEHNAAQQRHQYEDKLARQRHQDQLQAQQAMRAQEQKRAEESQMRIEQLRRETAQYEAQLRKETDEAKAIAEAKGRAQQERANFDLAMERAKFDAAEFRTTVIESIREAGTLVGAGARDFLSDWQKISTSVGGLTLLALGVYTARTATQVAGRYISSRLGKPPLIRETSRASPLTNPFGTLRTLFTSSNPALALDGVVLEENLKSRLNSLSVSTTNAGKNRAPYRHALLYGPPGTGKTLFAKKLAGASGMDYAIMSGGDVSPLGREAVTEIHKLFDWSSTSRKGLLIFVDEADAFLRKRSNETMTEDTRNALNAFLYRTGTETRNFMLVFASNVPDQLDFAVLDRADEAIEFSLPGPDERAELLKLYFDKHVRMIGGGGFTFRPPATIKLDPEADWDAKLKQVADKLEGFSGREISKLAVAFQAAAYGSTEVALTLPMVDRVVEDRLRDHAEKKKWRVGSE